MTSIIQIYFLCYIFFHYLENIISVFQTSFTAFKIANFHVIYKLLLPINQLKQMPKAKYNVNFYRVLSVL